MNVSDLIGRRVRALILGQYQESLTPEMYFRGTLVGFDQGIFMIRNEEQRVVTCIPSGQCLLIALEGQE
ncbi:hypothetical protein GCM10007108_03260 [Thermogymnomonas acidicola]|uniref:Uncharacterized protein n=1 Tax=Thermogymnomonas acidicola TaxID=399579 RepID=A0AA37F8U7_9ARCH|nr:hypothetical protein [Thermogymnomonas acidicola]GGM68488.1 hypothetical protein GCM10007108_03260 [Thermogymnomonas acidicola]